MKLLFDSYKFILLLSGDTSTIFQCAATIVSSAFAERQGPAGLSKAPCEWQFPIGYDPEPTD
jgi:hypothetical protein